MDLPLEVLAMLCQQLDLCDLVRVAGTCKRLRHGDGGLETVELPTKSPEVTALRELAFPGGELVPSTRPTGCAEPRVTYLARDVRQRRCREAPPIAASFSHNLFVDSAGLLLTCGIFCATGHGDRSRNVNLCTPVAAMAGVQVRSVAAGLFHSLATLMLGRSCCCRSRSRRFKACA
jgi:hypothetical protein